MTNTERKLDESKYFFERLDIDDPYFDYNLSAFLSAARSIAWVMRYEFSKQNGWNKWFDEYSISDKTKGLLKEINALRIETAKREGIRTNFFLLQTSLLVRERYYPDVQKFNDLPDGEYVLSMEPLSNEVEVSKEGEISFAVEINRSEKPYDGERVRLKSMCKEYLDVMAKVVTDCVNKFVIFPLPPNQLSS